MIPKLFGILGEASDVRTGSERAGDSRGEKPTPLGNALWTIAIAAALCLAAITLTMAFFFAHKSLP